MNPEIMSPADFAQFLEKEYGMEKVEYKDMKFYEFTPPWPTPPTRRQKPPQVTEEREGETWDDLWMEP